jgi:hypothetical protein
VKRYLKYIISIVAVWIVLVIAGLIFSRSIEEKIINILSEQASKYLLSEIHIRKSDIHFSVFQKFPLASVELKNICVKLPSGFKIKESKPLKGDTLLFAKELYLQLNILSLLSENYELRKISVEDGFLQILTDKEGNSSLDILRKTNNNEASKVSADIKALSLSKMVIFNSEINTKSEAIVSLKDVYASGVFTESNFSVKLNTEGLLVKYVAKNQELEPNLNFTVDIAVENKNKVFSIRKGSFSVSNIPFKVIGTVQPEKNMLVDLLFSATKVPVKQIDKELLRGLLGDNGIELKNGLLNVQATLIGYASRSLPAIKVNFKILSGKVLDTKHNLLLENIYLSGKADNGTGHDPKSAIISVDTFSVRLGKSVQWGKLQIKNLITPTLAVHSSGTVFYDDVKDFVKLKDITITDGEFSNKCAFAALIDKNSKSLLQDIALRAKIDVLKLNVDFPTLQIPSSSITGNVEISENNQMQLNNVVFVSGKTDFTLNGSLTGFLDEKPYLNYQGSIQSKRFQADEFFGVNSESTSQEINPIEFPDSIRIAGNFHVSTFAYGKFETNDARGNIEYDHKNATITNFTMNGFEGSMSGIAKVGQDKTGNINLFTDANLSNVDVKKLFFACNNFLQDFIGYQNLDGSISGHVLLNTSWSNKLEFIPSSVIAQSEVVLSKGELKDYEPLMGLSKFIKVEELKDIKFENFYANIAINKEKVYLEKTRVISSALSFDCSGVHGFDNKYEYRIQLALSDLLWKKTKSKNTEITEFGYVVNDKKEQTIVPVIIVGNGTEFDVKYDKKTARNSFQDKVEQQKLELKGLFNSTENQVSPNEGTSNTENTETKPVKLEKTDSGKYRTRSNDFILEWDDSEDTGKGNNY